MLDQKITTKYIFAGVLVVFFTWLSHEFAHWLTSEQLGYHATMRINSTSFLKGENPSEWHQTIVSAAGPILTLLQGLVICLILVKGNWNKYLYLFLFTAFYMRFLAGLMNFINLNDEGRISEYFGLGTFTLPILVSSILFFMVYKVSRKWRLNWKFQIATILVVMIASSALVLGDQAYVIRII